MLRTVFFTVLAALAIAAPATVAHAQEPPLTREDVQSIVRDYLLANPEVLEEAFAKLQERRQAEADADRQDQLAASRDALEHAAGDPVLGNPEGDVTLVEFFDYNCGYCKKAHADLERMLETDPALRVVMKEFPVLGRASMEASAVSIAVNDIAPESYEIFHGKLLNREGQVDRAAALDVAEDMGLPIDEVREAMNAPVVETTVRRNYELAQALGLSGTPSYVIGDFVEFGAVGFDTLRERVNLTRCGARVC